MLRAATWNLLAAALLAVCARAWVVRHQQRPAGPLPRRRWLPAPCRSGLISVSEEDDESDGGLDARASDGVAGAVGGSTTLLEQQISDTFQLVYTCGRCETRNMLEVKRASWESGIVISTCQGCNVKHVLADRTGLMDLTGEQNFTDVLDMMNKRGEAVHRLGADDPGKLEEFFLTTDDDGNIQFVPREGEDNVVRKDRVSAVGPIVDEAIKQPDVQDLASQLGKELNSEDGTVARADTYEDSAAFTLTLPSGPEAGDLLQLTTHLGLLMMPVPEGAYEGCQLQVALPHAHTCNPGCLSPTLPARRYDSRPHPLTPRCVCSHLSLIIRLKAPSSS